MKAQVLHRKIKTFPCRFITEK